jgi:ATP adenylyltransferase
MEHLWAPWRMGYILNDAKDHEGCFLCDAVNQGDDGKSHILHRARHCFIIMNLYPYNSGHLLVVPYAHVPDMNSIPPEELTELMGCTQEAINVLQQEMKPEAFNVGINIGKAAGAGLPEHLHIQIVPRWTGDTGYISVFDQTRVMPETLEGTYERLKPYFERLKR